MLNTFENKDRFHQRRLERERHLANIDVFSQAMGSEDEAAVSSMVDELSGFPLRKKEEPQQIQTTPSPHRTFLLCLAAVTVLFVVSVVSIVVGMNYQNENGLLQEDIGFDGIGSRSARYERFVTLIIDWGLTSKARLEDQASPAAKALNWLVEVDTKTESIEDSRTRYALATLYFATQDPPSGFVWQRSTNWLSNLPVCLWYGVYCHDSEWESIELNLVGSLNVSANGLVSSIPPELFLLETRIHSLDLSNNALSGPVPSSIGLMQNLRELYLGPNELSSTLPSSVGKMQSLTRMYINDCLLTGTLPSEIASLSRLQALDFSENQLTGTLPRLAELTDLLVLYLDENSFSGLIPTLPASLVDLRLRMNMLSGEIPTEIGNLEVMQTCYLDSNLLMGKIPPEMERSQLLQDLHLYNNRLSGSIPSSFGRLEMLRVLYLDHNKLSSSLAPELGLMRSLESVFINDNSISGTIPATLSLLTNLEHFVAQSNQFSGTLSDKLGFLVGLQDLRLQNNLLTGSVPQALGELTALSNLELHGNDIDGEMPIEVCELRQSHILGVLTADCAVEATKVICNCCSMCY